MAQWSRGFLRRHQWLEESWEPYVPEELDEEYAALLMTLSFFASKDLAEAFCAETELDLAELAAKLRERSCTRSLSTRTLADQFTKCC